MDNLSLIVGACAPIVALGVPWLLLRMWKLGRMRSRVLVIVDDAKNGTVALCTVPVKDGHMVTENKAEVRFNAAKSRRVIGDVTGRYLGLTAYIADKHSGVLLERADDPRSESVNKEAARFNASMALRDLGSPPGIDLGPWVKYAAIVISLVALMGMITAIAYFTTKGGV